MDNCVKPSKHRKEDMEYSVTYDFKYIDPGPEDAMCRKKRVHLVEVLVGLDLMYAMQGELTNILLQLHYWTGYRILSDIRKFYYIDICINLDLGYWHNLVNCT